MNISLNKYLFDYKKYSYKSLLNYLHSHDQRRKRLHCLAEHLLSDNKLSAKSLAFKKHFFRDFSLELAGACGCSEVLPDHMRINSPENTQIFIEMMIAMKQLNLLGTMSNSNLARIISCIFESDYDCQAMENRLKNKNPDYEEIGIVLEKLIKDLKNKK